ncbi:hypothetical protein GQ44DRAFT_701784 [Phaeosphaeriaceae sp. PMI808]|nr:hypothetical protein GQ44DRAFT_701784 [Phaeosphaeriaceae sp. PMI808]
MVLFVYLAMLVASWCRQRLDLFGPSARQYLVHDQHIVTSDQSRHDKIVFPHKSYASIYNRSPDTIFASLDWSYPRQPMIPAEVTAIHVSVSCHHAPPLLWLLLCKFTASSRGFSPSAPMCVLR